MTNVDQAVVSGERRHGKVPRSARRDLPLWQETILLLLTALVLALIIKSLFVQAFYIPSPSMEPQFVENDRILVEKVSYWGNGSPERGDIVVFDDPGGWLSSDEAGEPTSPVASLLEKIGLYPSGGHLVKRVIGIGGDRVMCCDKRGRVVVNGHSLNEDTYLPKGTVPSSTLFDVRVPPEHFWVMGDNRSESADSRFHMGQPGGGFVPERDIVGKALVLLWPWARAEIIHRPPSFSGIPAAT